MKKLLTTTALVGSVAFAGAANADAMAGAGGLNITLGGEAYFEAGFSSQDNDATGTAAAQSTKFFQDTEVHVNVEGTTEEGLVYGATIELEADTSNDSTSADTNADKAFLYVETSAGRFEMGSTAAPTETMKVGGESVAVATGGIDGNFTDYVQAGGAATFVFTPNTVVDNGTRNLAAMGDEDLYDDANKLVYYTPRWNGFQAGVAYTPDTGNTGQAFTADNVAGEFSDVFGLGVNYEGQYDQVGIRAAVTGEFGESENAAVEDLAAWQAGLEFSFEGFKVAGGYGDHGDSGLASNTDADFWTLGASYETGPFGLSVTWFDSEVETAGSDNEFQNISVGADYQLAPGLVPYVEVNFFDIEDEGTPANDNDGTVVLVGTALTF